MTGAIGFSLPSSPQFTEGTTINQTSASETMESNLLAGPLQSDSSLATPMPPAGFMCILREEVRFNLNQAPQNANEVILKNNLLQYRDEVERIARTIDFSKTVFINLLSHHLQQLQNLDFFHERLDKSLIQAAIERELQIDFLVEFFKESNEKLNSMLSNLKVKFDGFYLFCNEYLCAKKIENPLQSNLREAIKIINRLHVSAEKRVKSLKSSLNSLLICIKEIKYKYEYLFDQNELALILGDEKLFRSQDSFSSEQKREDFVSAIPGMNQFMTTLKSVGLAQAQQAISQINTLTTLIQLFSSTVILDLSSIARHTKQLNLTVDQITFGNHNLKRKKQGTGSIVVDYLFFYCHKTQSDKAKEGREDFLIDLSTCKDLPFISLFALFSASIEMLKTELLLCLEELLTAIKAPYRKLLSESNWLTTGEYDFIFNLIFNEQAKELHACILIQLEKLKSAIFKVCTKKIQFEKKENILLDIIKREVIEKTKNFISMLVEVEELNAGLNDQLKSLLIFFNVLKKSAVHDPTSFTVVDKIREKTELLQETCDLLLNTFQPMIKKIDSIIIHEEQKLKEILYFLKLRAAYQSRRDSFFQDADHINSTDLLFVTNSHKLATIEKSYESTPSYSPYPLPKPRMDKKPPLQVLAKNELPTPAPAQVELAEGKKLDSEQMEKVTFSAIDMNEAPEDPRQLAPTSTMTKNELPTPAPAQVELAGEEKKEKLDKEQVEKITQAFLAIDFEEDPEADYSPLLSNLLNILKKINSGS